jgi:hypothetical protein
LVITLSPLVSMRLDTSRKRTRSPPEKFGTAAQSLISACQRLMLSPITGIQL